MARHDSAARRGLGWSGRIWGAADDTSLRRATRGQAVAVPALAPIGRLLYLSVDSTLQHFSLFRFLHAPHFCLPAVLAAVRARSASLVLLLPSLAPACLCCCPPLLLLMYTSTVQPGV